MQADVGIIGAGPAGIAAAVAATRAGVSVVLIDRGRFPRPKVCGGCLNGRAVAVLDRLGLSGTLDAASTTTAYRVGLEGAAFTTPLPSGRAISRFAWDAAMVEAARAAGVTVLTQTHARLQPAADPATRTLSLVAGDSTAELTARLVIAADGLTQSATRAERSLRTIPASGGRLGAGALLEDGDAYAPGTIHMATAADGYVGLVRVERGRLNVAAALDADALCDRSLAEATAAIVTSAGWPVPSDWHTATWTGTPPLTRSTPSPVGWRVATAGDAAGYVEPFTGEGMAWALAAGEAVGCRAGDWLDDPDCLQREWPQCYRRVVARRRRICQALAWTLRRPRLMRAVFPVASLAVRPAAWAMNRR